jgi:hypothetical protein
MAEATNPSPARDGEPPSAAAVAGLAREVEGLRRAVDGLGRSVEAVEALPARVENLAGLVSRLAGKLAAKTASGSQVVSWLAHDPDEVDAEQLLTALCGWLHQVFLRYVDGARALTDCWAWHPEVIEELLWLWAAWSAAYDDPEAKISAAADWHDRLRPGVVRRIRDTYAKSCSIENHTDGREHAGGAVPVPVADAIPVIAEWWTHCRDDPAPVPTDQQLAQAAQAPSRNGTGTRR